MEQITVTAKIQVSVTDTDKSVMNKTMSVYANACNYVSDYVFHTHDLIHQGSPPLLREAQAGVDLLVSVGVQAPTENGAKPGMGYE